MQRILKNSSYMCVLEQTATTTTVRLSNRKWARLLELDKAYRLAQTIKRSMQQVESTPSMSVEEAIATLRALWRLKCPVIIRARIVEDELQLIYIYDKADYATISDTFLRDILKRVSWKKQHDYKLNKHY